MKDFGEDLRRKREGAGMSQEQLASKIGVHVKTIRNLESGAVRPTADTLSRLRSMSELGLKPAAEHAEWAPHAWFAPHHDALRIHTAMHEALNRPRGAIDQTFLYLDGKSAVDFIQLSTTAPYAAAFRAASPLQAIARRVLELGRGRGIDIHGLGAGDGRSEARLAQHVCDGRPEPPDLRLCLLDISSVMLHEGYRHAADKLERRGVAVFALAGNFNELSSIPVMSYRPPESRRLWVYTLLGGTGQNLDSEIDWLRELHNCAAPGDLLTLDVRLAQAPAGDVAAIRAAEPMLREGPRPTHFEWLSGPIERHTKGAGPITFRMDLLPQGHVPGAYELDVVADIEMRGGGRREFIMLRLRSYDPQRLSEFVRPLGWETELLLPYGVDPAHPSSVLILLRRV
jgi:transcriptional regulator with XRE-family HTH domain